MEGIFETTRRPVIFQGSAAEPGKNIDAVNIAAGMKEFVACGYGDCPRTEMVIIHALQRWARGDEAAAEAGAIDQSFYGVNVTCWRRILAAALANVA